MNRAWYVIARAGEMHGWLAGPFPSIQAAWAMVPVVTVAFHRLHPKAVPDAWGASMALGLDDALPMPPGVMNDVLGPRYWTDEAGRLHCAHGLILYGTLCVVCEKEALK